MTEPIDDPSPATRPTAHDVARHAGVSQSAVSRAFTDGASISPATRAKVEAAARHLGYRPNFVARSLITRRSAVVGVVMGYFENQFYPAVLHSLSDAFARVGMRILLFLARDQEGDVGLEELLRHQIDAVVLISARLSSGLAEECRRFGVPVLYLNRRGDNPHVSSVTGENTKGAAAIARFLAAGAHRRFGYLAGLEDSSTSRDREAGFSGWLAANGFAAPVRAVGHYDFAAAMAGTRALLAAPERPDAIFCANDHMAIAAIEVARGEFGLAIGRDISIVGFDDVGAAEWPSYALTTYSQPTEAMAAAVIDVVQDLLGGGGAVERHEEVAGTLVVRRSARLPADRFVA